MLPHLADRPLNLQRFPDGAPRPGFWQKDLRRPTRLAPPLARGRASRRAAPNTHLVADRIATLCWLGNQAAFEIHAWTSRLDAPGPPDLRAHRHRPGRADDLGRDAGPRPALPDRARPSRRRGYPKLTGKRGIQVWIPIEPRYAFDETSAWVEGVSRAVGGDRARPRLLGVGEGPARRSGPARLHPERLDQDARRAVRRPARRRRAGLGADHLGRARRPVARRPTAGRSGRWSTGSAEVGDLFAPAQTDLQVLPKL